MDDQELLGLAALAGIDVHNLKYEDKKSLIRYAKVVIREAKILSNKKQAAKERPDPKPGREPVTGWNGFGAKR